MNEDVLDLPRGPEPNDQTGCDACGDSEHEIFTLWPVEGITQEAVESGLWPRLLCETSYNREVAEKI